MRFRGLLMGVVLALFFPIFLCEISVPFKIPLLMSANFGELRPTISIRVST